jgi:hypothetical protein
MTIMGGCLCGAIRYQVHVEPKWICHCHCGRCRKNTGSPIASWLGFPAGTVEWLSKQPTRYRSSKDVERSFCPVCGSTIGFHRAHETSIAVGSIDAPEQLQTAELWTGHVWFKEHIPWFDTADDWQRHSEFPPGRAEELDALSGGKIMG